MPFMSKRRYCSRLICPHRRYCSYPGEREQSQIFSTAIICAVTERITDKEAQS